MIKSGYFTNYGYMGKTDTDEWILFATDSDYYDYMEDK